MSLMNVAFSRLKDLDKLFWGCSFKAKGPKIRLTDHKLMKLLSLAFCHPNHRSLTLTVAILRCIDFQN